MIFETILGEDFERLHPKLKQRYQLSLNQVFHATGTMHVIHAGPKLLNPLYHLFSKANFLFPESGEMVPFNISYSCAYNDGQYVEIDWQRQFHFPHRTRTFNTKMTVDLEKEIVKDYMGKPAIVNSELQFDVTKEGFLITRSKQQQVVLGKCEMKSPAPLAARAFVLEGYDDELDVYTIHLSIYHNIFGRLVMYAGQFTQQKN
ncbi:DUF4166 domain-containing protein [Lysinibacillus sp. 2017]|uniref:DUF4166 domain-containing protein n=1 Tax=unclassified Lysinibacillus TaxID=2636778 RepID=UPI000D527C5A|nr:MULTISPECIES: DUF4166 domain-containing protein [unclassified Lysinibacillus]AWE07086.1 DUF4166 domain-containing protein [Lysinibacillus sp. 2017]TGN36994.1 DUF4166 domain-containing protein [Lysinibacillus sp. S2017]